MRSMLILGLLVAGAAGAFAGLLIADNTTNSPHYVITLPGHHLMTLDTVQAFLYGIALAVVFCLGIAAIVRGAVNQRLRRAARMTELRDAGRIRAERDEYASRLGIPIHQGFLDDFESTAPLPPTIYPWTKT